MQLQSFNFLNACHKQPKNTQLFGTEKSSLAHMQSDWQLATFKKSSRIFNLGIRAWPIPLISL
jgi:hypothetical protein